MDRREFLIRAARALVVLPTGALLVDCSSSSSGPATTSTTNPTQPDTTPPAAAPQVVGTNDVFTSNVVSGHSHTFAIATAAFSVPPLNGVAGETSIAASHLHTVTVTQADLQAAMAGQTVKVESSNVADHSHVFTIVRVA